MMIPRLQFLTVFFIGSLVGLNVQAAVYQENVAIDRLAEQLIEMRSEVDSLHQLIQEERLQINKDLASLTIQKGDLAASIDKEKMKIREAEKQIAKYRESLGASTDSEVSLIPIIKRAAKNLQQHISTSIPFHGKQRVEEVEKLMKQLDAKVLKPSQALSKIWSLYEDEFRLARESGLHKQIIEVDGDETLAEVIHLGLFSMYFKTPADEYGFVFKENGQFQFRKYQDSEKSQLVSSLFESFGKKVRVGRFDLPNAILEGGSK